MREGFDRDHAFHRHRRGGEKIKRAILKIEGKEPVERQKAGEERTDP
jgi:hypothetical protein